MALSSFHSPTIIAELLRQQTPVTFRARGPSMKPTIRDGSQLHCLPAPARLPRGSIVLYTFCGRLCAHRLLRHDRHTRRMYVVGDAALTGGRWLPAESVLGVVVAARDERRERPLATRAARWRGLLRHVLRPARRWVHRWRQRLHALTSAKRPS
ncbi:MAG TPA: S24/S26 family peptidase [Kiritimatiellia bacterium]|jgi:hypothetical protein|nr:S24/S26 family peptidase [Kiritimatiellia bacterium]OQC56428.1 MAG: hypothetical protein BWX54_01432 [Verrucomicrobia bacterium ADurb.Bin018]MBP9573042.1 S24/S26 family peptidase [Kiritimatiellia bacterium]HOD99895.1 S24/S26 family peptidase [Kiritimatiellia bacterium]HOE36571.1 S24/S26 family peptidase [Kiritimatiellia bacterium]